MSGVSLRFVIKITYEKFRESVTDMIATFLSDAICSKSLSTSIAEMMPLSLFRRSCYSSGTFVSTQITDHDRYGQCVNSSSSLSLFDCFGTISSDLRIFVIVFMSLQLTYFFSVSTNPSLTPISHSCIFSRFRGQYANWNHVSTSIFNDSFCVIRLRDLDRCSVSILFHE